MKRILSLLLLLAATMFSTALHAQGHFDWAKGYSSNQSGCLIKGSVADTEGNLYILGSFTNDATWDGERLLPIVPYGPHPNTKNILIAKISPRGEMLWKKVIHSNNGQSAQPHDIKMVGDTAFACLVRVSLPMSSNYCYYLDTLLPAGWHDYPIALSSNTTLGGPFTGLITFDFAGNVKEQHFMRVSFIDTLGNDYVYNPNFPERLESYELYNSSFDIDSKGNIYISRQTATDHVEGLISVEESSAIGLKFWVDNQCVGTVDVRDGYHPRWLPQLLKFSPHMETLLGSRYVFQKNKDVYYSNTSTYTKVDVDDCVYLLNELRPTTIQEDTLVVDSLRGIFLSRVDRANKKAAAIKFSPDLVPLWLITLDDSVIDQTSLLSSHTVFHDIEFDNDSNLIFLSVSSSRGTHSDTTHFYSIPMYDGVPLPIKNNGVVLVFEQSSDKPRLRSYGEIPAYICSELTTQSNGNLICKNNRIFVQTTFEGGIVFPNIDENLGDSYASSLGLSVFDYKGEPLYGLTYGTTSPSSCPGSISLRDSILYLSMLLRDDQATFGDITLDGPGYFSAVAKYVDTAFMSCYSGGSGDVRIVMAEDGNAFVAYPNPFRQRVNIEYSGQQPITAAYLTDIMGRTEQVELSATAPGRYTLDLTARPQAAYLLTLVTQAGRRHTVRLLKQSEVFGR